MTHSTKRFFSLIIALAMILSLLPTVAFAASGTTLYLVPNSNWTQANARFAIYYWNSSGAANWVSMSDPDGDGTYEAVVPAGNPNIIFCRMNPGTTTNSWDTKWNQTADLTIPTDGNNCYTVKSGTWDSGGGAWSKIEIEEPETTTAPPEARDVIIHYRNLDAWSAVHAHSWIENGDSDQSLTTWPGTALTQNPDHANWYTLTISQVQATEVGIVFNDGGNGGQTPDIMIADIPEAGGEYWYDGALLTSAPDTWADGSVETIQCDVTLHFADTQGWGNVYLYTWTSSSYPTGSWPGTKAGVDEDGFHTMTFCVEIPVGQTLNFIFNNGGNGSQSVDLTIPKSEMSSGKVEKWVQPTTENTDDGDENNAKFFCDIVDSPDAVVQSPVVDGTSVTFEYKNATASQVQVFGSMNDWATGYSMTKNAYGVWSVTLEDLEPAIYTYKFVVDGNWIGDPVNNWIIGTSQDSAFIVLDPNAEDTNEITVKIHYERPNGDYSGWNIWAWSMNLAGAQYDLVEENGEMTATLVVPGRSTMYIGYIPRYSTTNNKWEAQEYGERRIDLSNIVSGTVHCYVDSGVFSAVRVLDIDVVQATKISAVEFDYEAGTIDVTTTQMLDDPMSELAITGDVNITAITSMGSTYTLTVDKELTLQNLYQHNILFGGYEYQVGYTSAYATDKFAAEYTYEGNDLGATWNEAYTTFRVWAPTAADVKLNLYVSGDPTAEDLIQQSPMTRDVNGTWIVTIEGDLNKTYYTYEVTVNGETVEACDPYARTTGVNGKRGMIIDLDSTDPDDWYNDENPNKLTSYTDAVIYELHVRDFSMDDSSGIKDEWKGKYLGLTQTGTTTANGQTTGLDYLKDLGITHLHLLPIYDYGSVDETTCDTFNWGYDPVNYNVPEGSYSTDPANGEVRVAEMKQMVSVLHNNGISVVMDVVYNHVYDAGSFCFNQIVPGYFSRQNADGSYSNASGCGNDTASEREMVRKYIVDSVVYWADEYHINGFRFDLVGLIDVDTINLIVEEVHKEHPDVLFYGEGWTMGTAAEPGTIMATQMNASYTPGMAYFNDRIRDAIAGYNGTATGFVSGADGKEGAIADNFMASPNFSNEPQQLIQYVSCHDNHTLIAKILLSTGKSAIDAEAIKMNNLAAATYLTAQGIPFIHAGEEMLRMKVKADGTYCENSYNASDDVNALQWDKLENPDYANTYAYYKGLIAFRKSHPALRYATAAQVAGNVSCIRADGNVVQFVIDGTAANDRAEKICVILNGNSAAVSVTLPDGSWNVCIDGNTAGTDTLYSATGSVNVAGISAMVLVQNEAEAAAQVNGVKYATVQQAVDAAHGQTVVLLANADESVTAKGDLYLDLNGKTLTSVTVQGTLYGMDSTTDDYDCSQGYGSIGTVSGTVAKHHMTSGKRYLTVSDNGVSFHRFYVGITHVTLRVANTGVGYKAVFAGDEVVQAQLNTADAYGYSLWLTENKVITRSAGANRFQSEAEVSLLLQNFDVENFGSAPVYAQVYMKLADGTVLTSGIYDYSLQQLVETVSANLGDYSAQQIAAVKQLCADHSAATADWKIEDLMNWTA